MNESVQRFLGPDGRLATWPSRGVDQWVALAYLASHFESGRTYAEREVNDVLNLWHSFMDWPMLRRELVEKGFLSRDRAGMAYQLVTPPPTPAGPMVS